jgi:hypothetical protein
MWGLIGRLFHEGPEKLKKLEILRLDAPVCSDNYKKFISPQAKVKIDVHRCLAKLVQGSRRRLSSQAKIESIDVHRCLANKQSDDKIAFFIIFAFLSLFAFFCLLKIKFSFLSFTNFLFCLSRIYSEFTFLSFEFDTFIEKSDYFSCIVNYGIENSEFVW